MAEANGALPGDEYFPKAQFIATRAIIVDVPPEAVWPWLVQVGCLRAGWYSNDLLDNLGHPSATTIVPDLQVLEVGQWVPMSPFASPSERKAFRVDSFQPNEWLLWTKPDSTWVWQLTRIDDGATRLVTRVHAVYDGQHPVMAVMGVVLMEFGDFPMMRRMLRGRHVQKLPDLPSDSEQPPAGLEPAPPAPEAHSVCPSAPGRLLQCS